MATLDRISPDVGLRAAKRPPSVTEQDRIEDREHIETLDKPSALDKIDPPIIEPDTMQAQPPQGRGEHPTITGDTARQGPAGTRILYVLGIGIVGAALLMAIAFSFFAGGTP